MTVAGRRLVCVLVLLAGFGFAPGASAQVPVWDPEEIARMAEKSARMAEALSHAVELLNQVDALSRTIGRFGTLSHLDFARSNAVEGLRGAGPEIGGLASNIVSLRNARIASFDDASRFVKTLTTLPAGGDRTTGAGQVRQALDVLYRKALEDGYALSAQTRESVAATPQRAALLVAQASAAVDLRGDVGADTAAELAVLDRLTGVKALLASLLEIHAVHRLETPSAGTTLR